jgi:glycosyltransferase involved in cell wall biosynthesis
LYEHLRSNIDIKLFTLKWTEIKKSKSYLEEFKISKVFPKRLGFSNDLKKRINKSVNNNEFNIIHNHGLWMMPTIYSGLFKGKDSYKLVLSPHGAFSEKALSINKFFKIIFNFLFQKQLLNNVNYFHATSLEEYKDIRKLGYNQPVFIIPPGVKIPDLKKEKLNERKTLLFLSRLHPIKGLDTLLKSWSVLEKDFPDWDLNIYGVGDEIYISKLKKYSLDLGNTRAYFKGPVYGDEKDYVLQSASLYVLPTHSENFGIAIAEALANATPVIVSKGAPWEDLDCKGAGWWIDIGVNPLTEKLFETMKMSNENLKLMGINGRNWMKEEYSWNAISLKFVETYEWINCERETPEWVK